MKKIIVLVLIAVALATGYRSSAAGEIRKESVKFYSPRFQPGRFTVDSDDRVYVPVEGASALAVYSAQGDLIATLPMPFGHTANEVNVVGDTVFVLSGGRAVLLLDREGKQLPGGVQTSGIISAAGAPDKTIWLATQEQVGGKVVRSFRHYDRSGNLLQTMDPDVYRVRVSPKDGTVFAAIWDGPGVVFSPAGEEKGTIHGHSYPAIGNCTADGNLLFGNQLFDPQGQVIKTFDIPDARLIFPREIKLGGVAYSIPDVALDQKGNLYLMLDDRSGKIGFVSYDAGGTFRFARGADFERLEAALPAQR
jgi:hypothetical protein